MLSKRVCMIHSSQKPVGDKSREKLKKLQALHSSFFFGKSYFEDDGTQIHVPFPLVFRRFTMTGNNSILT